MNFVKRLFYFVLVFGFMQVQCASPGPQEAGLFTQRGGRTIVLPSASEGASNGYDLLGESSESETDDHQGKHEEDEEDPELAAVNFPIPRSTTLTPISETPKVSSRASSGVASSRLRSERSEDRSSSGRGTGRVSERPPSNSFLRLPFRSKSKSTVARAMSVPVTDREASKERYELVERALESALISCKQAGGSYTHFIKAAYCVYSEIDRIAYVHEKDNREEVIHIIERIEGMEKEAWKNLVMDPVLRIFSDDTLISKLTRDVDVAREAAEQEKRLFPQGGAVRCSKTPVDIQDARAKMMQDGTRWLERNTFTADCRKAFLRTVVIKMAVNKYFKREVQGEGAHWVISSCTGQALDDAADQIGGIIKRLKDASRSFSRRALSSQSAINAEMSSALMEPDESLLGNVGVVLGGLARSAIGRGAK